MRSAERIAAGVLLALLVFVLGCSAFPEEQLAEDFPAPVLEQLDLQPKVRLGIGPAALFPARFVAAFLSSGRELRAAARGVHKVEVGVFEIHGRTADEMAPLWQNFGVRLQQRGWELLTRVRDPNELTWVFYLPKGRGIRQIYVVSLDRAEKELVLVKIYGRLERTIQVFLEQPEPWNR